MAKRKDIPQFGLLSGLKVLCSAVSIAGPFAAELLAEQGADVIIMEPPVGVDVYRYSAGGWGAENERRNIRSIVLNRKKPSSDEIFKKLISESDIFIEASRGESWSDLGMPDQWFWNINPKLVIAHLSGFGQFGVEEYVKKPGYDHTVQAFCGMLELNGFPDRDPALGQRFVTDYYVGGIAYGAVLAAYINVLKTGVGESIDVAQYEVGLRCQGGLVGNHFDKGIQWPREGSRSCEVAGAGYYKCGDGNGVYLLVVGDSGVRAAVNLLGLEYGGELFPEGTLRFLWGEPGSETFDKALEEYCLAHTALEVEQALCSHGIACMRSMTYEMMEKDPHYIARDTFIEVENINGETQKQIAPVPRFKNNPTQIWRGCPTIGHDGKDILADLGYDDKEIEEYYDQGVVSQNDIVRLPLTSLPRGVRWAAGTGPDAG